MMEKREATMSRSMPDTPCGALKATRTASSMPNRVKAAATDSSVRRVRVFLRNSAASSRGRYFTVAPSAVLLDQRALVQMQGAPREAGRLGIMRHHDQGLAVFAVETLQERQHRFGRMAV